MRIALAFLLALGSACFCRQPVQAEGFEWHEEVEGQLDLRYDGRPALRYMMPALDESTAEKRNETFKPYHHVWSPDGETLLTKGPGGLFPHHRGLFYGFNRITYGDGKRCDTWHCTGKAYQAHVKELAREAGPDGASHRVAIDWHGADGERFAEEIRALSVRRETHHDVDGWLIDFASRLKTAADAPIRLDGDPQHAGFQFRASQEVPDKTAKETYYLRVDGKGQPGETRNWDHAQPEATSNRQSENLPWNGLCVVIGGKRFTVVYLDHPENPKPARYSERDYGRFGSYFVADVTPEKPLEVQYRLWVQAGEMSVEQCEALCKAFVLARREDLIP